MKIQLKKLQQEDTETISKAFTEIGWNKPGAQYERYCEDQDKGTRIVLVAFHGQEFTGYLTVNWYSDYPYFNENRIPEIQDLNVLPKFRRKGIATKLMDKAEEAIGVRSPIAGIGVGLHPGYNAAQRMYVLRGYIPDGNGVTYNNEYIKEGQMITADDRLVLHFVKRLKPYRKRRQI